jgi:hypothetical protein
MRIDKWYAGCRITPNTHCAVGCPSTKWLRSTAEFLFGFLECGEVGRMQWYRLTHMATPQQFTNVGKGGFRVLSFELFSDSSGCTDEAQKRQRLLHCAGTDVQDIFLTFETIPDEYAAAKIALDAHLKLSQNFP